MTKLSEREKVFICPVIRNLASNNSQVDIQSVIDLLEDFIVDTVSSHVKSANKEDWKSNWTNCIIRCAKELDIVITSKKPTWKTVEKRIHKKQGFDYACIATTSSKELTSSSSLKSPQSSSSSLSTLKKLMTKEDKNRVEHLLDGLDRSKLWYLEATRRQAQERNEEPLSVEEKMVNFGMKCNYVHLCHSLILDVDDSNWAEVFSDEELTEVKAHGPPILRELPRQLKEKLDELEKLETALSAYKYGQQIKHDPVTDLLPAWLSQTLMNTAKFFLREDMSDINSFMESDRLYYLWMFVNTIFHGTSVKAVGMEKSSVANAAVKNAKRKLSAIKGIENKRMGHRVDTIYQASNVELGCVEIGAKADDTKEIKDAMFKMPIVLRDMMIAMATEMPNILHDIHFLGYSINGHTISLIDADVPQGYVTRIRRTNKLPYPTCTDDYIPRMIPLLELAAHGKKIIDDTLYKYRRTYKGISEGSALKPVLPPCCITSGSSSSSPPKTAVSEPEPSTSSAEMPTNKRRC